jgi:hypothetical protein
LETTFPEFIFLEFTFPGIHFPKRNYFPANKQGLNLKIKNKLNEKQLYELDLFYLT